MASSTTTTSTSSTTSSCSAAATAAAAAAAPTGAASAPPPPTGAAFDPAGPRPLEPRRSSSFASPESLRSSIAADSLRSSCVPSEPSAVHPLSSARLRGWLRASSRSLSDSSFGRRSAPANRLGLGLGFGLG